MTEERLKDDLRLAFRDWARAAAERPESFWERQRLAVRDRIERAAKRRRVLRRSSWAAAAVLVLGLTIARRSPRPPAASDPDHELLVAVERSLEREVPAALEPAALLAGELSRAAQAKEVR